MNYKELILQKINDSTGIKSVELVLSVMSTFGVGRFVLSEYNKVLQELIDLDEIIELEYCLPDSTYRVKSLFFPIGTEFIK